MSSTFRDIVTRIAPTWLRRPWGERFLGAFGLTSDTIAEAATLALQSAQLKGGFVPEDALGWIGLERRMPRYPGESATEYEARLYGAWDAYTKAGTAFAIISQLEAFGIKQTLATWTNAAASTPLASQLFRDWVTTACTLAPMTELDPNGNAAIALTETATTADHQARAYGTVSAACAAHFSIVVKPNGRDWLRLERQGVDLVTGAPTGVNLSTFYNIATCAIGTSEAGNAGFIERLSDGWVKCTLAFHPKGSTRWWAAVSTADGDAAWSNPGDASLGLLVQDDSACFGSWPVTVYTAREWTRGSATHPETNTAWWSRFWVYLDWATHRGVLSAEQKASLVEIVRKWKSSRWHCAGIVLGGNEPTAGIATFAADDLLAATTTSEVLTL